MAQGNYVQTNFLAGEWGKLAQGRMDDPRYKTAMATCLNSIPVQEGSVVRRPGFGRVGHTRNGNPAVLKSFAFTESASLSVEFTDSFARFIGGDNFIHDLTFTIGSITSGVVTATAHGLSTDDQLVVEVDNVADALIMNSFHNRQFRVDVLTADTFKLYDALTGLEVTDTVSPTSAVCRRIHEIDSPYTEDMLGSIRTVQAEDDMVVLHPSTAPRVLTISGEDAEDAEFEMAVANLKDGPYLDPVTGSLATPSATTGVITLTLSFSAYEATRAYSIGDFVTSVGIGYRSLIDQNVGNTPASSPTAWGVASPGQAVGPNGFVGSDIGRLVRIYSGGSSWTWGKITALSSVGLVDPNSSGVTFIGDMAAGGGLAAAFDGVFTGGGPEKSSTGNAYVGLNLGSGNSSTVLSAVIYGVRADGGGLMDVRLYGSNSAPGNSTDGTLLGSVSNTDGTITITSSDSVSTYRYLWVRLAPSGSPTDVTLAEVQFFNAAAAPGSAVEVQVLGSALANTSPAVWRLGVYSDTSGWPTCGCYHQGRLFLGGAVKNRWDASKSNDIYNFEPTAANGTVADNNSIAYYFNATDRNHIFWMRPSQQGVICGTQGGEWVIKASENNNNLTPTSAQAHRVTKYECANAEPVTSGLSTVFIQRHRRRTMEFISDIYSGKWFAPDLNEFSKQVTKTGFEELASIEELTPVVWARRTDGKLVGCTYRRVSMYSAEPPKFLAWHQHTLGHNGFVVSISSGPAADTTLDTLNTVVRDPSSGVHYVEYLRKLTEEDDEMWAANFLDGSIVPPGGKLVTENDITVLKLYGFTAYEGLDRDVWACGQDLGRFTVADGVLSIPLTSTLTAAIMAQYTTSATDFGGMAVTIRSDVGSTGSDQFTVPVLVGLSYTSRGQLLRPNRQEDVRTPSGPGFAKTKRSHELHALLHNTRGISFGTRFDKLRPLKLVSDGGRTFDVDEAFNGVYTVPLEDLYGYDSQPCWEVSRPYPATVCAFGAALNTEG